MKPQTPLPYLQRGKPPVIHIMLLTSLLALCGAGVWSSRAQPLQEEREIENKVPSHVPIQVKVKNLEKVKDLKNERWMRDVEIEVKNTGDKPIYYLKISLFLPEVKSPGGREIGFFLRYGRADLIDLGERATPEDMPIEAGEIHVFRVPEKNLNGWELFKSKYNKSTPKKIGIEFHSLSYGDGTGFVTTGGMPIPKKKASWSKWSKENDNAVTDFIVQLKRPPDSPSQFSSYFFTGRPLAGKILYEKGTGLVSARNTTQTLCCPGTSCEHQKEVPAGYNCDCGLADRTVSVNDCNDSTAYCSRMDSRDTTCSDDYGNTLFCTEFFLISCGSTTPTPTPTPTPAPSPIPCPEPEPNECCICVPPSAVLNR